MSKFVCKNCGSENVEIKAWVNANTNECNQTHFIDEVEPEDTLCLDCETHSGIELKQEE